MLVGLALLGGIGCNRPVEVEFTPTADVKPAERILEGRRIRMQEQPDAVSPDVAVAAGGRPPAAAGAAEREAQAPKPQVEPPIEEPYGPPLPVPAIAWPTRLGDAVLPDGTFVRMEIGRDGVVRATIHGQPSPVTAEATPPPTVAPVTPAGPAPAAPPQAVAVTPQPVPAEQPAIESRPPPTYTPASPYGGALPLGPPYYAAPGAEGGEETAAAVAPVPQPGQIAVYIPFFYPWPILVPGDFLSLPGPFAAPAVGAADLPGPFGFGPRPVFPVPGQPFAPLGANSAISPLSRGP